MSESDTQAKDEKSSSSLPGRRSVWADLCTDPGADSDWTDVLLPWEVIRILQVQGLPHLTGEVRHMTPEHAGSAHPEVPEPPDIIVQEGTRLGRANKGRGGLDERFRAYTRSGRGGAQKYAAPRLDSCTVIVFQP